MMYCQIRARSSCASVPIGSIADCQPVQPALNIGRAGLIRPSEGFTIAYQLAGGALSAPAGGAVFGGGGFVGLFWGRGPPAPREGAPRGAQIGGVPAALRGRPVRDK